MLAHLRRTLEPASHSPRDAIRTARRSLVVLTLIAVLGPLLAAGASTITNLWTYQSLQRAEEVGEALRIHGDIDQLHDALRGDVAIAAVLQQPNDAFHDHARQLHDGIHRMRGLAQREEIAERMRQLEPRLLAYVALAQRAMQQRSGPTSADVARVDAEWQALAGPLSQVSNELQAQLVREEQGGRSTYHNGNLLRLIAVILIVGGILLIGQRIGSAVLHASRQLADATETARRASQSRTDFLAAMSHEIRTPMTGVLGMVELLAAEPLAPRPRRYVEALRASGRHLLHVINDILDFTRIESGRIELERIDFSLPELLERVRSLVHPMVVERGLELDMRLAPHSPPVLNGDPTRIQQVLLNLVGNAVKFTERGSVTVDVRHVPEDGQGLRYRFEVRDTGIGIPPESQINLFAAFRQADETISRRYGGSGLGLAICKRLVDAMGGVIGVSSTPGNGSTFFFELPLALGTDQRMVERDGSSEPIQMPPRRILIAEDVEINRHVLATTLERAGHQLTFAHDGAEAVALAGSQEFDLVLMDVQMPVMDGLEATRRIRALDGPNRRAPILALTANVMTRERELYLSVGMNDCLTKPIDWEQLFGAIARHTRAAPAPQPAADPLPAASEARREPAVLLDESVVATLQDMAAREVLSEWLQIALDGYERSLQIMARPAVMPAAAGAEAHKMRGSAGTLGLARIGELATRIEDAADQGSVPAELVTQLAEAVEATRGELAQRSLL